MNQDIIHLPNGDFEVVDTTKYRDTYIGYERIDHSRPVYFKINGKWERKGWLMPQIT